MSEDKTWILLYRSFLEHNLWNKDRLSKGEAWLWLLMKANWKAGKCYSGNEVIECGRGSLLTSVKSLEKNWRWTTKQVRLFIDLLAKDKMITILTSNKQTKITICKYEQYQTLGQTEGKQKANGGQTEGNDIKKGINNKKEITFKESELFGNLKFIEAEIGEKYLKYDLQFYYDQVANWATGKKQKDWLALYRNFILKDIRENKAKLVEVPLKKHERPMVY